VPIGIVKFYNSEKRFGFIHPEDGGGDIIFSLETGARAVSMGQKVSYDLTDGHKGLEAIHVQQVSW
jgi:CspA family cold shock protein